MITLKDAIHRVRFWRAARSKPFLSDKDTGCGYKLLSYNVLTDRCQIRLSKFGYVEGYDVWSRELFEQEIDRIGIYT
ncbi:MAG: hypothetical protein EOO77_24220 [Oxalobacteraceae bacterium]|nr:MAG: hypothetical protein EOO77_24220 [Oxalobacteraceae bacterium]